MKNSRIGIIGILLLLGCVSAQSSLIEMKEIDEKWVNDGALLPENLSQLYSYKTDLINLQTKISSGIGGDKEAMTVLLNAKIAMVEAQENVIKGLNAYNTIGRNVNCSTNSPAKKAVNYFSTAAKKAAIASDLQKTFNEQYAGSLNVVPNENVITVMDALKESAKRYSDGIQSLCQ